VMRSSYYNFYCGTGDITHRK